MHFDVLFQGEPQGHFDLPFVGRTSVVEQPGRDRAGTFLEGYTAEQIEPGLASFQGTKRRFAIEKHGDNVFVDDYAHHPTEVSITIDAARKRFPGKKLIAIFKPHRVSRVFHFADDFAAALKKADEVYLCDFTSIDDKRRRDRYRYHISRRRIAGSKILSEDQKGADELAELAPAVYLFMSSKDIYGLSALGQAAALEA